MNIAFVLGTFPTLSETFILNQITGVIDRGHSVDIYADGPLDDPSCHPEIERYGLMERTFYTRLPTMARVRSFAARAVSEPGEIWGALRRRLAADPAGPVKANPPKSRPSGKYDIVHAHFGTSALAALVHRDAGQLSGKLVTTFYGYDLTSHVQQHGRHVYDELFKRGDVFLALSDSFASLLRELGCPADRIRKQTLGIHPSRFPFVPRRLSDGEAIRIVSIARLVEKKGIAYALRALARVRTAKPIEYTVIGDGVLRGELEALARHVVPTVTVRFTGWLKQDKVAERLRGAHILLAPSVTAADGDQEGTPVAIIEALASGLPIISTLHSGIPEMVQDGTSGRLVPERDDVSLARAIDDIAESPDRWIAMGKAGRAYVEQHHDINALNDELVRLYERLLNPFGSANDSTGRTVPSVAPSQV
jgi:colanic acid/amylovoran/stewartan biosynthesis glycosyltransferase WcaL/AmsK/CpsK